MRVNLDKETVSDSEIRRKCLDLAGEDAELLFLEGFDEAIVGVAYQFSNGPIVVYDREAILDKLTLDLGDHDQARDFFEFNIAGSFAGSSTPIIMSRLG